MKLSVANILTGILGEIKINKIADDEARGSVNKTFISVRRALRPVEKDRDELVEKFRADWREEIDAIVAGKGNGSEAFQKANEGLNETIRKMLEEGEAVVPLFPVSAELLYNPDLWGENITLGEMEKDIAFLVKHGVAEE